MEIPLFPLSNLVLFPNIVVPLHIFEDRYKLMVNECIDNNQVFGIVLLRTGEEESQETIHRVGVTASIVEVERLTDGRMNILCEGEARFRVFRFIQEKPYWKGAVDLFQDTEGLRSTEGLYEQVAELYRKLAELGAALSGSSASELTLPDSAIDLSYMVSYVLDIDYEEKQRLLEMTSTAERLRVLVAHLMDSIRKMEQQIAYKRLITKTRGNGDLGLPGTEGKH